MLNVRTASFIPISDIVGEDTDFYSNLSEENPRFSWGSNNRTLVDPNRIITLMSDSGLDETYPEVYALLQQVEEGVYIDMEN